MTVVAAAFAAVLGSSSVLKVVFGDGIDAILGVLTVAAALAVAGVTAAPLLTRAFTTNQGMHVAALLGAAWFTLTATGGQLGAIVTASLQLEWPWPHWVIPLTGVAGAGLLGVYSWHSLMRLLIPEAPYVKLFVPGSNFAGSRSVDDDVPSPHPASQSRPSGAVL